MEQEKMRRVRVKALLTVVSSKPSEPAGRIQELSWADQAMVGQTIHLVFYYRSNPFGHGSKANELESHRASLSRVLDDYPVVTGRLSRRADGGWRVKCTDAGVRMLQASVCATMDGWLRTADALEERDLTLWEDMPLVDPSFWSPFRIQINEFKCGGLAIGLSCTHLHADITSAALLVKSWAEVHRARPLTHTPIFSPSLSPSPQPFTQPETAHLYKVAPPPPKFCTATMKFTVSAIEELLAKVRGWCPDATAFDALAALFWSRATPQLNPKPANTEPRVSSICVCIDSRDKGLTPRDYFGNGFVSSVLRVDESRLSELGLLADSMHRHVVELEGGGGFPQMYGSHLSVVDVAGGGDWMYGAEFEEGKRPFHVSYRVGNFGGEGLVVVMPSSEDGGGRTVTVVLPEEQINELFEDEAIQGLGVTMLFSGRES